MKRDIFSIINRNHQLRSIMDRIDNDLRYIHFANQLSKISARRKAR